MPRESLVGLGNRVIALRSMNVVIYISHLISRCFYVFKGSERFVAVVLISISCTQTAAVGNIVRSLSYEAYIRSCVDFASSHSSFCKPLDKWVMLIVVFLTSPGSSVYSCDRFWSEIRYSIRIEYPKRGPKENWLCESFGSLALLYGPHLNEWSVPDMCAQSSANYAQFSCF